MLVISGKVYVAWKGKMLHDVALHDVISGHQAYMISLFMAHRILHVAKTTRGSRDARALRGRRGYKLASGEQKRKMNMLRSYKKLNFYFTCKTDVSRSEY